MGSSFQFSASKIPPILCPRCGNNAHCIRRTIDPSNGVHEMQTFECETCEKFYTRSTSTAASDDDVQHFAERLAGVPGKGTGSANQQ